MYRCWTGGPAQLLFNAEPLYFIQTPAFSSVCEHTRRPLQPEATGAAANETRLPACSHVDVSGICEG
jgi:hypothetical protein